MNFYTGIVTLLVVVLLTQTAEAVALTCGLSGVGAGALASQQNTPCHQGGNTSVHPVHEQDVEADFCNVDRPGEECSLTGGCALPMQLLASTMAAPMASDNRSTGIASHPIVLPPAPVFLFLRPPIA
ncbi:hypothetical protein [Parahaliea mediterranea]|uniref:hypothetical protein n=1 Tax=Parahaliea mediterranea TaxID=651086 RepID=UPI00130096C7|nr:hypothetical protein [Parahaliea mediterranea]